jgi:hypothetical protein
MNDRYAADCAGIPLLEFWWICATLRILLTVNCGVGEELPHDAELLHGLLDPSVGHERHHRDKGAIAGTVCYVAVMAIALSTNVRINKQIGRWSVQGPPGDWTSIATAGVGFDEN